MKRTSDVDGDGSRFIPDLPGLTEGRSGGTSGGDHIELLSSSTREGERRRRKGVSVVLMTMMRRGGTR